mmetsp:Transcript_81188/g.219963  ORF Transcript_81188/g.219963 Transcript_81188/m.219963 type:complete len:123 (-) Transcript_81188:63-431(-)
MLQTASQGFSLAGRGVGAGVGAALVIAADVVRTGVVGAGVGVESGVFEGAVVDVVARVLDESSATARRFVVFATVAVEEAAACRAAPGVEAAAAVAVEAQPRRRCSQHHSCLCKDHIISQWL